MNGMSAEAVGGFAIAVGAFLVQAGATWNAFRSLRNTAATKQDVKQARDNIVGDLKLWAVDRFVAGKACKELHESLERELDRIREGAHNPGGDGS